MDALLKEYALDTLDELLEEIGLGKRIAALIARRLHSASDGEDAGAEDSFVTIGTDIKSGLSDEESAQKSNPIAGRAHAQPMYIRGTEGILVSFARCCHPVPGDGIVGFISTGKGIVIHTTWCKNIAEYADRPSRWIDVAWENQIDAEFTVEVRVEVSDRKGALASVATAVSDQGANIENVSLEHRDGFHTSLNLIISVADRVHLARIIRKIRTIPQVVKVARSTRGSTKPRTRLSDTWLGPQQSSDN